MGHDPRSAVRLLMVKDSKEGYGFPQVSACGFPQGGTCGNPYGEPAESNG
jgi:hypothetical protein